MKAKNDDFSTLFSAFLLCPRRNGIVEGLLDQIPMDSISIRGARTHNLANIDLDLPRDKLIVITGLSGSGKSSLAFDTIYAEGQRRYVESLSSYARQFLSIMEKPDVDHIEGLSPAISIEQKSTSHNPRSTVGTITEIYDYLRLLYARVGTPRCPDHDLPLDAQTISQMVDQAMTLPEDVRFMLLAPVVRNRKGEHAQLFDELRGQGFVRARVDGTVYDLDSVPVLELRKKHTIEVVIDRFRIRQEHKQRLAESLETAVYLSDGLAMIVPMDEGTESGTIVFSSRYSCPECDYSLQELEPRMFSFNNPNGACEHCDGLGVTQIFNPDRVVTNPHLSLSGGAVRGWDRRNAYYYQIIQSLARHYKFDPDVPFDTLSETLQNIILYGSDGESIEFRYPNDGEGKIRKHPFAGIIPNLERRYRETDSRIVREELAKYISQQACPDCRGQRLNRSARHVFISSTNLPEVVAWPIDQCLDFFTGMELPGHRGQIAEKIIKEIRERLRFLVNVGLDYLTLERQADSLSGGESQRIRLASQIGAGLVGVMYILDEPSIGLHQRDNARLLKTLTRLRDLGNTVIVVEHDEEAICSADHVVDIGPGAGVHGGQIIFTGSAAELCEAENSITGDYLSGRRKIAIPTVRTPTDDGKFLRLFGATGNNLKSINLEVPAGLFVCVTGDSMAAIRARRHLNATKASKCSTKLSILTRALLAGRPAPTPPPTPAYLRRSGNCSRVPRNPGRAATNLDDLVSTSRAAAAKPVSAMDSSG
jgi:excinuclease ABC subunit A